MSLDQIRYSFFLLCFCSALLGNRSLVGGETAAKGPNAQREALQSLLEKMCDHYRSDQGMTGLAVAAIARREGQAHHYLMTLGTVSKKSSVPITPYTEFRIGPLTQLFTASILAYFVQSGQVSLSTPIRRFFSKSVTIPTFQGKEMTLLDLATHTSGLPDIPYSLSTRGHFRTSQMQYFLSRYQLKDAPGTHYDYSYFGYAILGNLLSRIGKHSLPELIQDMVLTPLNLKDTTFFLSTEQKTRYAVGYDKGQGISPLDVEKTYSTFIGAGGMSSTIRDLALFLSFQMKEEQTSLNALLPLMQNSYYQGKGMSSGLAWQISPLSSTGEKLMHLQGELFGFASYMGFCPQKKIGVVLLANQGDASLDPLAQKILALLMAPPP